jgi:hypothetical protein
MIFITQFLKSKITYSPRVSPTPFTKKNSGCVYAAKYIERRGGKFAYRVLNDFTDHSGVICVCTTKWTVSHFLPILELSFFFFA